MDTVNPGVDEYLADGCGRCSLYQTPQCKVQTWQAELQALRSIMLDSGLKEELKWQQPCYTFNGQNVAMMSCFKDYSFISFFKGSLLQDPHRLLASPGAHSQAVRQLRFTDVEQIHKREAVIRDYVQEAIDLDKAGRKVEFKKEPEPIPEELQARFDEDPVFAAAFAALTPGRQRSYLLHIAAAKQSGTRESRIEKCMPKIFAGKGFNER